MVNVKRSEVAARIHEAKEHGDLSENAEYEDAKNEQAFVEGRIQTLSALIKNAILIDEKHSTTHVQIGSTVEVESTDGKETYTIVGSGGGRTRGRQDLQRVAGRARAPRPARRARRSRSTCPRETSPTRSSASADERRAGDRPAATDRPRGIPHVLGRRAGRVRPGPTGRQRFQDPVGHRPRRQPARRRAPRRDRPRPRDAGTPARFLYGVDDLDPMDAAGAPDAATRSSASWACRSRTCRRPPAATPPSYARHFVGQLFLGTFARLGIHPEFYWMSEQYATGAMDPYIRIALDRAARRARHLPPCQPSSTSPADWLPLQVICENCGRIGTTHRHRLGRRRPSPTTAARPRDVGPRLRPLGPGGAVRRSRQAAVERRLGGQVEPVRRHHRGLRQGPRDAPAAPATAADAISREVFDREPPLNVRLRVPQHRRPQDEHLQGHRRRGARDRRAAAAASCCASCSCATSPSKAIEFDPEGDTIPGLFDEFDRIAARRRRPRRARRAAARPRAHLRAMSLVDADADAAAEAARVPAALPPPRAAASRCPAWTSRRGSRPRRARRSTTTEQRDPRRARPRVARAWLDAFAPDRYRVEVQRRRLPPRRRAASTTRSAAYLAALADGRRARAADQSGDAWQDLIFGVAQDARAARAAARSRPSTAAFLGRANGPRAGWLLASLDRRGSSSTRLRAASAPAGGRRLRDERRAPAAPRRRRRDPPGRRRQGRGPGGRRRRRSRSTRAAASVLGEVRRPARRAQRRSASSIGDAIRGGAAATRPGGRRAARPAPRRSAPASTRWTPEVDAGPGRSSTTCCCASRIPPTRTCPVGGERRRASSSARGASPLPRRRRRLGAQAALGGRRALGLFDLARGAKVAGSGLPALSRARARRSSARSSTCSWRAHAGARHAPRSGRRPSSTRRRRAAPARSRTRKTRCTSSRATTCTWCRPPRCRSPTSTATRSSKPTRLPDPLRGLLALLPPRGRRRRHRTPAASCASTSSTRSRWSASSGPRRQPRRSSWLTTRAEVAAPAPRAAVPRQAAWRPATWASPRPRTTTSRSWAPGVEQWLEVSSVLQLPRLPGAPHEHPLAPRAGCASRRSCTPSTAPDSALPRTVAALLETHQQPDGSVLVPEVLRPRLGERLATA